LNFAVVFVYGFAVLELRVAQSQRHLRSVYDNLSTLRRAGELRKTNKISAKIVSRNAYQNRKTQY
jgi:hypothetical protein